MHAGLQVLLRALRDFNLGKLTSDDTSIFMGLLNDLFPKTLELVPRAVEKDFEAKVCSAFDRRLKHRLKCSHAAEGAVCKDGVVCTYLPACLPACLPASQ
jgi:hypothetical protein